MTVDDVLFGFPYGFDDAVPRDDDGARLTPHGALVAAVLPALLDPPCRVSFSGGRDSSTVLAVATAVARREGLPLPVPVTFRHHAPDSREDAWQHLVLDHLGLTERVTIDVDEELAFLGPVYREAWDAIGLHWPINAHGHLPLMRACGGGGSILTGIDGDGLLTPRAWASVWGRPPRSRVRGIVGATVPPVVRRAIVARGTVPLPWLTPEDEARRRRARAAHHVWPRTAAAQLARYARARYVRIATSAVSGLGDAVGVAVHHPLNDARVIAALGGTRATVGFRSRAHATAALAGGTLPVDVLQRSSKARFDEMFGPDPAALQQLPPGSEALLPSVLGWPLLATLVLADD